MRLYVYDKSLNRIADIEERYISVLWSEGYNTIQNFSLELAATEELKNKINPNCYLYRHDRKTVMVIKNVEVKNGKIVSTGKQASYVLDDVAHIGTIPALDAFVGSIGNYYEENTNKYPFVKIPQRAVYEPYPYQIGSKSFLSILQTQCQYADVGFNAHLNTGYTGSTISIDVYKPIEKDGLVFSSSIGNLGNVSAYFSMDGFKNYAYVLGQGEGENRVVAEVDQTNGGDRYELVVDARDVQMEDGETNEAYMERLKSRGAEKLLEHQQVFKTAFQVAVAEFGDRFDLGDILTVNLVEIGLSLKARVTRFTEKSQNNQNKITIDVGNIYVGRI